MILKWQSSVIVWIVMLLDNNHLNRLFANCFSLPNEMIFLYSMLEISRLVTLKCTYYHCISYEQLLGLFCIVSRVCLCIYFDMYVVPCNWSCFYIFWQAYNTLQLILLFYIFWPAYNTLQLVLCTKENYVELIILCVLVFLFYWGRAKVRPLNLIIHAARCEHHFNIGEMVSWLDNSVHLRLVVLQESAQNMKRRS